MKIGKAGFSGVVKLENWGGSRRVTDKLQQLVATSLHVLLHTSIYHIGEFPCGYGIVHDDCSYGEQDFQ